MDMTNVFERYLFSSCPIFILENKLQLWENLCGQHGLPLHLVLQFIPGEVIIQDGQLSFTPSTAFRRYKRLCRLGILSMAFLVGRVMGGIIFHRGVRLSGTGRHYRIALDVSLGEGLNTVGPTWGSNFQPLPVLWPDPTNCMVCLATALVTDFLGPP